MSSEITAVVPSAQILGFAPWAFSLPIPVSPWTANANGRVATTGDQPIADGKYGNLGILTGQSWIYHRGGVGSIYGDRAYQVAVVGRGGAAMVGDFTLILQTQVEDVAPITGMFLSPTAKTSDLRFYSGNSGATFNGYWFDEGYLLLALNTYNTGTAYRKGLLKYTGGASGPVYKYNRTGTTLSISVSTSSAGPWSGAYSGTRSPRRVYRHHCERGR